MLEIMITGFENITQELNEYEEQVLLPVLVAGLETKIGKEKCVTSTYICQSMKDAGYKITPARLRKLVHEIRVKKLIKNLISNNKGYWVSNNVDEINTYRQSLKERANSIVEVLKSFY
jgi:predicted GTPase